MNLQRKVLKMYEDKKIGEGEDRELRRSLMSMKKGNRKRRNAYITYLIMVCNVRCIDGRRI